MNTINQSIRVGLFFMFGAVLSWVLYQTLSEKEFTASDTYIIQAPFKDIRQLKNGDEVRLAGVQIGVVTTAKLSPNDEAIVIMQIEKQFGITQDSVATIATAGLLGANYISISPGVDKDHYLGKGAFIQTIETADLASVMTEINRAAKRVDSAFATIESAFGGGLGNDGGQGPTSLFQRLNVMIDENRANISKTLENLASITSKVDRGDGTLGRLINDNQAYEDTLAAVDSVKSAFEKVGAFFDESESIVHGIKEGKGTLGILLSDDTIAQSMQESVQNVKEFTDRLNNPNNSLNKFISNDAFYTRAEGVLNTVENAVDSLDNNGPITAVGVAASALF